MDLSTGIRLRRALSFTALLVLWAAVALVPRTWFGVAGPPMPTLQFWFVSFGAALCLTLSLLAWTVGLRRQQAEVVLLGGAFSAMSILSLAHGLGAPGAVVQGGVVSEVSMALAFPVTAIGLVPLFMPGDLGTRLARHAATWSSATITLAVVLSVGVWFLPDTFESPVAMGALVSGAVVVVVARVAARQIRLWRIGRNTASLAAAAGIAAFGVATAVGLRALPDSIGWWLVHVLNNAAVLMVGTALMGVAEFVEDNCRWSVVGDGIGARPG